MVSATRRLWQLIEPYHAVTYFEPECAEAFAAVGWRGFWRGYFAGRAAPFGPTGPGLVTASFFGFEPGFVARVVPSIWTIAPPEAGLRARVDGADAALRRLLGDTVSARTLGEAADLARRAIEGARVDGRALFAANADLEWPTASPHATLWHAATLMREHRGDGHVAALTAAGLDPCEAHRSQVAANGAELDTIAPYRGWDDDDWAAGTERLRARGWIDDANRLTERGRAGRAEIEATTERLAQEPIDRLGPERTAQLLELLEPIAKTVVRNGVIRYPNPIGVPRPD